MYSYLKQINKEVRMNCSVVHMKIKTVLEESSAVYSMVVDAGGHPNMDYAGYACHVSLNRLRKILNNPSLTSDHLESLLRRAARKHADHEQRTENDWSDMMASYLSNHANAN